MTLHIARNLDLPIDAVTQTFGMIGLAKPSGSGRERNWGESGGTGDGRRHPGGTGFETDLNTPHPLGEGRGVLQIHQILCSQLLLIPAAIRFGDMYEGTVVGDAAEIVRGDLIDYCRLDTMAMVMIVEKLRALIGQ
jgi:hypothetical protein